MVFAVAPAVTIDEASSLSRVNPRDLELYAALEATQRTRNRWLDKEVVEKSSGQHTH